MNKNDCIEIFNAMIRGTPVSFKEKLFPMVSEYLTEIKYENSDKMINLIVQKPQLIQQFIPKLVEYYCQKYCILELIKLPGPNDLNIKKTILYYE